MFEEETEVGVAKTIQRNLYFHRFVPFWLWLVPVANRLHDMGEQNETVSKKDDGSKSPNCFQRFIKEECPSIFTPVSISCGDQMLKDFTASYIGKQCCIGTTLALSWPNDKLIHAF